MNKKFTKFLEFFHILKIFWLNIPNYKLQVLDLKHAKFLKEG